MAITFPPNKLKLHWGLVHLLIELFYIGMAMVRTDGGTVEGRSRDSQNFSDGQITTFYGMGLRSRALRAYVEPL